MASPSMAASEIYAALCERTAAARERVLSMYNLPQQLLVKNPFDRLTLKPVGVSCNLEPLADIAAQVYFVDSLHRPVLSGGARAGGQADRKHQRCESRSRRNHVGAYRARDCGYQKVR